MEGFARQEVVVASTGIILTRQASPASRAPPAMRLFINIGRVGSPKQEALEVRGSAGTGRCLHIRRQHLPLLEPSE